MAGALGFESSEIDGSIFNGILQCYNTKVSFLIILLIIGEKYYFYSC